jgi:ubiquinone/menaquinone biosynthesis C-methylase UbiE
MWAAAAPAWAEHSEYVDRRTAAATPRRLELAGVHPGQRVLELASGPGGLGLAAARLVGPNGQVVISDVVHEMTSIAAARAKAQGLDNVTTLNLDLEQIDQPSASFDAVLCREGLGFGDDSRSLSAHTLCAMD